MRLPMRHWAIPIATYLAVCVLIMGNAGCKREAPSPEPDPKPAAPQAKVDTKAKPEKIAPFNVKGSNEDKPKAGIDVAKDDRDAKPPVDERGDLAKELQAREFIEKAKAMEETPPPESPPPTTVTETPATPVDVKKKDKGKDPMKEPAKDPTKDPKSPEFKEPAEVGGKSFKDWQKEMHVSDPGRREAALKAVLNFGPKKAYEAVPDLITQLSKKTPIDLAYRVNAITMLSTIFKYTDPKDRDPKHVEAAFSIYKRFLSDSQVIMKVRTVQGIVYLGPIARSAIPEVITMTRDPATWEARKEAMQILMILAAPDGKGTGPNADAMKAFKVALDRFTDGELRENCHYVRETAVQALTMLSHGTGTVPAEFRMNKALKDPSLPVRLLTLQAIGQLKNEMDTKTLPSWVLELKKYLDAEQDPILKIWAHAASMTITGNISETHMLPIVKYVEHKDVPVRQQALTVIGMGGEKSKKFALSAVLKATADKEPSIASQAYIVLAQMHHWDPILAKLSDKEAGIKIQALHLISAAGPPAKPHVMTPVVNLLKDKDVDVVDAAIGTLESIQAFETISILEGMMNNKQLNATIRESAQETVLNLKRMLKEQNEKKKTP
ncbi:MAG: hypothetical protein FJ303_22610 [Planctomycetes bacterium]|nr:hypothetical protein [Planctomycetota bacterium]